MVVERRYVDEEQWEAVALETAVKALAKSYRDPETALSEMRAGHVVRTAWAQYRMSPSNREV